MSRELSEVCVSVVVSQLDGTLSYLDKADSGKGSSENDKEGDCLSDWGMLHLWDNNHDNAAPDHNNHDNRVSLDAAPDHSNHDRVRLDEV